MRKLSPMEAAVCFKLFRKGAFGKGHMLIDNVVEGFPSHRLGQVRDAVEQLLREGILGAKASKHGKAVFIASQPRAVADRVREHPEFEWLPK